MRIVQIVGARPEFVQVASLSRALRRRHDEILIHTGQHHDAAMSTRFFDELRIPRPDVDLGVAAGGGAGGFGEIAQRLAASLATLGADIAIVRGDTHSTAAGALAAKHLLLPLVHVEAGMRSYDRTAPEEINRIVADHLSDVCLTTGEDAVARLASEGIARNVHVVGDVMYDSYLHARDLADASLEGDLRRRAGEPFDLLTLHRAENVDDRARLGAILDGFRDAPLRVLFPVHPRTANRIREFGLEVPERVEPIEPLGYLPMLALEARARTIFTDSGGVQREAYFAAVPCVTLRDATEWTNTVEAGWNRLAGASRDAIARWLRDPPHRPQARPPLFGEGNAAERIVAVLESAAVTELVTHYRAARAARGPR